MSKRRVKRSNIFSTWVSQAWNYVIQDDPEKDLLVYTDRTGVIKYIFLQLIPQISAFFIVLPFLKAYEKIKSFYRQENKNLDKTIDLILTLLSSSASITLTVLVALGAVYLAPYILLAGLGLTASFGLYNIIKHAYLAYRAHKTANHLLRNEYLLAIPKFLLIATLSGLGMVAHLTWVFNLGEIFSTFHTGMLTSFFNVKDVFVIFGCLLTLGTVPSIMKKAMDLNEGTLRVLAHPLASAKVLINNLRSKVQNILSFVKAKPFVALALALPAIGLAAVELLRLSVHAVSRIISLTLVPGNMIAQGVTNIFSAIKEVVKNYLPVKQITPVLPPVIAKPVSTSTPTILKNISAAATTQKNLRREYKSLKNRLTKKITDLQAQAPSPKRNAKLFFTLQLKHKLGRKMQVYRNDVVIADLEKSAKNISSGLYQSFWTLDKGGVESLAHDMKKLDARFKTVNPQQNNYRYFKPAEKGLTLGQVCSATTPEVRALAA